MQEIGRKIFSQDNNFMFWFHYVGDIISCIPNNKLEESLGMINSMNIQSTSEIENNNEISFMDLEIMKLQTGQQKFRVHRKQTHTDH